MICGKKSLSQCITDADVWRAHVRKPVGVPETGGATGTGIVSPGVQAGRVREVIREPEAHGRREGGPNLVALYPLTGVPEAAMPGCCESHCRWVSYMRSVNRSKYLQIRDQCCPALQLAVGASQPAV